MGGIGSGRKKEPSKRLRDAIEGINVEEIVESLKEWAKGREVICPHCDKRTGYYTPDTVALQSAIELLNRRLGKVPQQVQLDITETIQLNADQIDTVLRNHLPQIVELYKSEIQWLLTEGGLTNGSNRREEKDVSA